MKLKKIPMHKIQEADYNPRVDLKPGDPEYEAIKRSLDEFGLVEPLVWNEHNGVLVGGHQRLKILRARGDKDAWVSVVKIQDKGREMALNVVLNKGQGLFDMAKVADVFAQLKDLGLDPELTGFGEADVQEILRGASSGHEVSLSGIAEDLRLECPRCKFRFKVDE